MFEILMSMCFTRWRLRVRGGRNLRVVVESVAVGKELKEFVEAVLEQCGRRDRINTNGNIAY